jgi:RNA polymerase sigma factor (sigma-70 family)
MTDDAECLRRYAEARDQDAFSAFVRRNLDLVYSAAFRQTGGDTHLAEDIVQKVFVAAAQKAASLACHPVIGAWLHSTTRYAAIDAVRARQRQHARDAVAFAMNDVMSEPTLASEWDKISPELDAIVASLRSGDREAVILRFFGGASYAEVGEKLHLSEGAARMRVERALEKMRVRLSKKGMTSSSVALGIILAEKGVMAAPAGLGSAAIATALGAPAVGALTVLGALQIMTSAKLALTVATVVTLASIAVALHEHRHVLEVEETLATTQAAAHHEASANLRVSVPQAQAEAGTANPAGPAVSKAPRTAGPLSALMATLSNPVIQKQNQLQARVRLDGQYGALFKSLSLEPDQIAQFKNLLVEKFMTGLDSMAAAQQQGINPDDDPRGFFSAVAESERTVDTQISALLGPTGFSQFQAYQETVPARTTGMMLSQALSYTATPLTDAQTDSLVQVLTQFGKPALAPSNPFAVMNSDLGVVELSPQGLAQAQGILSPQQIQALQDNIQEESLILENRMKMGH